jgi:hypothetical protein
MHPQPKKNPTESILGITVGFLILFLVFNIEWFLYLSLGIGLIGLFFPPIARWIEWGWMNVAKGLGFVNTRIILLAVFFVILLPLALLSRLFRKKDYLQLKRKESSYFKDRSHTYTADDLKNPW